MEIIILRQQEEVLEQDKNAAVQETNLLLGIGLAKICGEGQVETRDALHLELGENIEFQCTLNPIMCIGITARTTAWF